MSQTAEIAYRTAWSLDPAPAARHVAGRGRAADRLTAAVLGVVAAAVWRVAAVLVVTA